MNKKPAAHSLIPWRIDPLDKKIVLSEDGMVCDTCLADDSFRPIEIENAAFIVRAVNAHEELLEACHKAYAVIDGWDEPENPILDTLRKAIARAEGSL